MAEGTRWSSKPTVVFLDLRPALVAAPLSGCCTVGYVMFFHSERGPSVHQTVVYYSLLRASQLVRCAPMRVQSVRSAPLLASQLVRSAPLSLVSWCAALH
jgi:hypothetical protein